MTYTPDDFKSLVTQKNPDAIASDGRKYSDIPSDELVKLAVQKAPTAVTNAGIPYSSYLPKTDGNESMIPFSGTVKSIEDYNAMTPDEYALKAGQSSHAMFPASYTDENNKNPLSGVTEGLKVFPNAVSDLFSNVIPGFINMGVSAAKLGWYGLTGLPSGDYSALKNEFKNDIFGQIWKDPSALVGPTIKSLGFGIGQSINDVVQNGDWGKAGMDLVNGIRNSATSFIDAPLTNLIAFKAAGSLGDAVLNPGKVLENVKELPSKAGELPGKISETAKKAYDVVTNPGEWADANIPTLYRMYTASGLDRFRDGLLSSIKQRYQTAEEIAGKQSDLSSLTEKNSFESAQIQSELNNLNDKMSDLSKYQEGVVQNSLAALNDGASIHAPDNVLENIYDGLVNFSKNEQKATSNSFGSILGDTYPSSHNTLISGIGEFLSKVNQKANPELYKYVSEYGDTLKRNQDFHDTYNQISSGPKPQTGSIDQQFYGEMAKKGYSSEEIASFLKDTSDPKFRNSNLSQLKSEDFNNENIRNILDNSTTAAQKLFSETIKSSLEKTIKDELRKEGNSSVAKYGELNSKWSQMKELSSFMNKERVTSVSKENSLVSNIDKISRVSPMADSMIRTYFFKKALDESLTDKGYDPSKMIDSLEKYRNILSDADKRILSESAKLISDAQAKAENVGKNIEQVGSTPEEVIKNIGKVSSLDDLQKMSQITGMRPEELGQAYLQNSIKANESRLGKAEGEDTTIESFRNVINDIRKFEGKSKDSQKLIDQLFPKDVQTVLRNGEEALNKYEEAQKLNPDGFMLRALKVSLGAFALAFNHIVIGPSWIVKGLKGVKEETVSNPTEFKAEGDKILKTEPAKAPGAAGMIKNAAKSSFNINSRMMRYGGGASAVQQSENQ